jgi:hypothetical protein
MRKRIACSLLTGAIVFALLGQSDASTDGKTRAFVYTDNKSADYAWVTVYGVQQTVAAKIGAAETAVVNDVISAGNYVTGVVMTGPLATDFPQGSWCVNPGASDKHGLTAVIHSVRIEMRAYNCNYADLKGENIVFGFTGIDISGQPQSAAKPGVATITGGGTKIVGQTHNMPGGGGPGGEGPGGSSGPGGPASIVENVPIVITEARGASQ